MARSSPAARASSTASPWRAGAREVPGGGQPLRRGVGGQADGGEAVGGGAGARRSRAGDRPEARRRGARWRWAVGEARRRLARAADGGGLAPGARRLGQLAGELGAAAVALERVDAALVGRSPSGQRSSACRARARRVAVGVHGAEARRPRAAAPHGRDAPRAQPASAWPARRRGAAPLEPLGELLGAAARRRSQATSSYSASRTSAWRKAGDAAAASIDQAGVEQLDQPCSLGQLEATTSRSNGSPATAATSAAARAPPERDRSRASRRRRERSRAPGGLAASPARARDARRRSQALAGRARPASSSTKNGTPWVRSWNDAWRAWGRAAAEHRARPARRSQSRSSGSSASSSSAAGAAELGAQAAQGVPARQLVGAVGGDHEHRQLGQGARERREHVERGLVGPVQVVEHDRAPGRDAAIVASAQRKASTSDARSPPRRPRRARGGRSARWRAAARSPSRPSGHRAQEGPQAATSGAVRLGTGLGSRAAQHESGRRHRRPRGGGQAASCRRPASPLNEHERSGARERACRAAARSACAARRSRPISEGAVTAPC